MTEMIAGTNYAQVTAHAKRYNVFSVDLSVAHTDLDLGLSEVLSAVDAPYATALIILAVPSAFQLKLNSAANTAIGAQVGLRWDSFEITEVYITNVAGAGTALISIEYRSD